MSCKTFQEQFIEYFLGELSSEAQHAIEQHLQNNCEACNREFRALHEATELLYLIAPQVELTQSQRDVICHHALSTTWTANYVALPVPSQVVCNRKHSEWSDRWYGLLAVVAGFTLVMLAPATARRNSSHSSHSSHSPHSSHSSHSSLAQPQLVHALEGERSKPTSNLKFVSFKDVSSDDAAQLRQPGERQQLLGFLLLDARAREIHLLGRIEQAIPLGVPGFELVIVTASEKVVLPLAFDRHGACRALVPLPAEPILDIELRSPAPQRTEAVS